MAKRMFSLITLVHSKLNPPPEKFDFVVRSRIHDEILNFYMVKHPGLDQFIQALAGKFEIVMFTTGLKEYASLVFNHLDKK